MQVMHFIFATRPNPKGNHTMSEQLTEVILVFRRKQKGTVLTYFRRMAEPINEQVQIFTRDEMKGVDWIIAVDLNTGCVRYASNESIADTEAAGAVFGHGKYVGVNPEFIGMSALTYKVNETGEFRIQVDDLNHPKAFGWHHAEESDWESDREPVDDEVKA